MISGRGVAALHADRFGSINEHADITEQFEHELLIDLHVLGQ